MADVPTHLELGIGEDRTIELPGLGTAGYVWDHEVIGAQDVIDVQWTRGFPPGAAQQPVGVSSPESVTLRALNAGEVGLRLFQHRRWEPAGGTIAERHLTIVVA